MGLQDRDYYREHHAEKNDMVYRARDATYHSKQANPSPRVRRTLDMLQRFFNGGSSALPAPLVRPPEPPPQSFTSTAVKPAPSAQRQAGPPELADLHWSLKLGFVLFCVACVGFLLYYKR